MHHPTDDELAAFALGTLDDSSIADHVAACGDCQSVAAATPGDTFTDLLADAKTVLDSATDLPAALVAHPRYSAVRLLGVGGMGTVWLAEHAVMRRRVAVKIIKPEFLARPGAAARFRREVAAAARLHHPNIVAAFDAEQSGDTHFLAMEYVDGVGLDELLKSQGALPVADACRHVADAAAGLAHAHAAGLVHRDVKPGNLMRAADGTVKVLDFGLAMLAADDRADASLTGANMVVGTPDYIAPEQAEHPQGADARADVYALGCTLYHLLAGQVPFPGTSILRKLDAHRRQSPPPLSRFRTDIPHGLSEIVMKMMAKNPASRFTSAGEVATALQPFADGKATRKPRAMRPFRIAVAATLLFGLIAAGGVVYRIQTEKGELVIATTSDDVEVTIKQGGKLVAIVDTKTQKRIELKSGEYDLELKDAEGLKLDISKATLTRGKETLATIERLPQQSVPRSNNAMIPPVTLPSANTDVVDREAVVWMRRLDKEEHGYLDLSVLAKEHPSLLSDLAAHDANRDGRIVFAELKSYLTANAVDPRSGMRPPVDVKPPVTARRMAADLMDNLDTNRDGFVDLATEANAIPNMRGQLAGYDTDKDGRINLTELSAYTSRGTGESVNPFGGASMPMGGGNTPGTGPADHWPPADLPAKAGVLSRLPIEYANAASVRFSPDTRLVAFVSHTNSLHVLESATGKVLAMRTLTEDQVRAWTFTPDSAGVVILRKTGNPNTYRFDAWDLKTGGLKQLGSPIRLADEINVLRVIGRQEKLVLGSSARHTYYVLDTAPGGIVRTLRMPRTVVDHAVTADGTAVVSTSNEKGNAKESPEATTFRLRIDSLVDDSPAVAFDVPRGRTLTFRPSAGPAKFGVVQPGNDGGKVPTVAYFDGQGKKLGGTVSLGEGTRILEVAGSAPRAVVAPKGGADIEVLDLADDDHKTTTIGKIPHLDGTSISPDGRVFAARTETGWNLYRLPELAQRIEK